MNAVSQSSNNFTQENGGDGSDSDNNNTEDSPEYYQPIYASDSDQSSDEADTQFHRLPNGHSNGVANGVSNLDLSDNDDDKEDEEEMEREEAADVAMRRALREDERRRNAPLTEENSTRVVEAMRGVRFVGAAPSWAGQVPEDQWIDQIRRLREPQTASRN